MNADFWNQRYQESGFAYGILPNDFLKSVNLLIPKGKVLSLAEGEGRNATYLAKRGYEVTVVDFSEVAMEKALQLAQAQGVNIKAVVSDLSDFFIEPHTWDGIISIFSHLPSTLRKKIHRDAVNGLKPNGIFILEAYTTKQLEYNSGGPKDESLLMNLEDVKNELSGLLFEIATETEREISEGKYHHGRSAVIQIVARKSI